MQIVGLLRALGRVQLVAIGIERDQLQAAGLKRLQKDPPRAGVGAKPEPLTRDESELAQALGRRVAELALKLA